MDIEEAIEKLNKFNEYENAVVLTEDALYKIQEAIETILKELEKKDDMIEFMANEICYLHESLIDEYGDYKTQFSENGEEKSKKEIKQYFEGKVEDV